MCRYFCYFHYHTKLQLNILYLHTHTLVLVHTHSYTDVHTPTLSPEELPGVPVACASGDVSVSVRVRGVEGAPVPRVHVEVVVGRIHCLLAPAQMHILTEMANNLSGARGQ